MRTLALLLVLAAFSPSMLLRSTEPRLGALVKVVRTVDGDVRVFRDAEGCSVLWKGVIADRVDLVTCAA